MEFEGTLFDIQVDVMAKAKKTKDKKKPQSVLAAILPKPVKLRKLLGKRAKSRYKVREDRKIVESSMDLVMEFRSLVKDHYPTAIMPSYAAEFNYATQMLDILIDFDRLDENCCRLWIAKYIERYLTKERAEEGKGTSLRNVCDTSDEFVPTLPYPEKTNV